jgi:hypothetical protein
MKQLILSCKKATYFISLKEEGRLSFAKKLQLRLHLTVCSLCRLFAKQTTFFSKNAGRLHEHIPTQLSTDAKERMNRVIKELTSGV